MLTLLYLLAFACNVTPYLRGPRAWRWAYAIPGYPWRHLLPIAVVIAYVVLVLFWSRKLHSAPSTKPVGAHNRWGAKSAIWKSRLHLNACARQSKPHSSFCAPSINRLLLFVALAVPVIQVALLFPESPDILRPLFYRTVSPSASGVFTVGSTVVDPVDFLRRYPELMPTFPVHPQRYPPGPVLLFYGARQVFEAAPAVSDPLGLALRLYQCHDLALMRLSNAAIAAALVQMTIPVIMGLIVFPLYGLARRTVGPRAALWTVIAYPLVPSFALWSARWDQFYPLLTCTAWYCFWRGLTSARSSERADRQIENHASRITYYVSHRRIWLLLGGLLLSLASFLSFGVLALLAPLGLSALLWVLPHPERRQWRYLTVDALVFFAGLSVPWLVYQAAFGNGFLDIWRVSMAYHLGLGREYWTWVFFHLYDFFAFLGAPLAIGFVLGVGYAARDARRTRDAGVLPLGFALGLLLLDISGAAQGEVARVWLFLTPFAAIAAAYGLARCTTKPWHSALVLSMLALQLLVFNVFLRVVTTGVDDPPAREHVFSLDAPIHPVDVDIGDGVVLLGYILEPDNVEPGTILHLTLYWQARAQMTQPYTVFTHVSGPDGHMVAQQDNMPQQGRAPTTCWIPGEVIADDYTLTVPPGAVSGTYTLTTGLYIWETGDRLPARGTSVTPDNEVVLTAFSIAGAP